MVRKQMEKSIRTFFWEGSVDGKLMHLASWKLVAAHFEDGRLGLGGLHSKNRALLAKWGWHFCQEPLAL